MASAVQLYAPAGTESFEWAQYLWTLVPLILGSATFAGVGHFLAWVFGYAYAGWKMPAQLSLIEQRVTALFESQKAQNDGLRDQIQAVNAHLGNIDAHLTKIDTRLNHVEACLNRMEACLSSIEAHFGQLDTGMDRMKICIDTGHDELKTMIVEASSRMSMPHIGLTPPMVASSSITARVK